MPSSQPSRRSRWSRSGYGAAPARSPQATRPPRASRSRQCAVAGAAVRRDSGPNARFAYDHADRLTAERPRWREHAQEQRRYSLASRRRRLARCRHPQAAAVGHDGCPCADQDPRRAANRVIELQSGDLTGVQPEPHEQQHDRGIAPAGRSGPRSQFPQAPDERRAPTPTAVTRSRRRATTAPSTQAAWRHTLLGRSSPRLGLDPRLRRTAFRTRSNNAQAAHTGIPRHGQPIARQPTKHSTQDPRQQPAQPHAHSPTPT
jgi:hypothetical protein